MRKLDQLIAEKVFGCRVDQHSGPESEGYDVTWPETNACGGLKNYSTDIAHAWKVVEKFTKQGCNVRVAYEPEENTPYGKTSSYWQAQVGHHKMISNDLCVAICIVALRQVGYAEI